jgi:hypothetical protein
VSGIAPSLTPDDSLNIQKTMDNVQHNFVIKIHKSLLKCSVCVQKVVLRRLRLCLTFMHFSLVGWCLVSIVKKGNVVPVLN